MGIFDALNTSVGGLQAQSFALQNISGNIANASTIGYKGIDTTFEDLIPDATTPNRAGRRRRRPPSRRPPSPPRARCRRRRSPPTWRSTATASSPCRSRPRVTDNVPVFSGVTNYTRRGDFQVNANGNLVNGAGYYLMGVDGRPEDRQPDRQRAAGAAIPEQLHSGAGHDRHRVCREPSDPAEDAGEHCRCLPARSPQPAASTRPISRPIPLLIGSPAPPIDAYHHRLPSLNNSTLGNPITASTALSGTTGTDSLPRVRRRRHHHGRRHDPHFRRLPARTGNQHQRHRQCRGRCSTRFRSSPAPRRPSRATGADHAAHRHRRRI